MDRYGEELRALVAAIVDGFDIHDQMVVAARETTARAYKTCDLARAALDRLRAARGDSAPA